MKRTIAMGGAALLLAGAAKAATTAQEWNTAFDLGASYTSGNSETVFVTSSLSVARTIEKDEYAGRVTYAFGEDDGNTTTEELLASASWRRLLSERTYAGLRADGRHDDLADIAYRISLTGLIGHYLIKDDKTSLSVEGGLGYTFEEQGGESDSYANFYGGERFEHKLSEDTHLFQSLAWFAPVDDLDDFQLVGEAGIETALSEHLSLKVYLQDKYENMPAAGREENDFKVVTGISYKF